MRAFLISKGNMNKTIREYLSKLGKKGGAIAGKKNMARLTPEQKTALAMKGVEGRRKKREKKVIDTTTDMVYPKGTVNETKGETI